MSIEGYGHKIMYCGAISVKGQVSDQLIRLRSRLSLRGSCSHT